MPDLFVESHNSPHSATNQNSKSTVNIVPVTANQEKYHYPCNRRTALVIVAYNRPDYLRRTFESLIDTLSSPRNAVKVDIVLSQDGYLPILNDPVEDAKRKIETSLPLFSFRRIHHNQVVLFFYYNFRKIAQATVAITSSLATLRGS